MKLPQSQSLVSAKRRGIFTAKQLPEIPFKLTALSAYVPARQGIELHHLALCCHVVLTLLMVHNAVIGLMVI